MQTMSGAAPGGDARGPWAAALTGGWSAVLGRLAMATAVWWVLAGGDAGSWLVGVPAILAATWAGGRLTEGSGPRLHGRGLLGFVPFFLRESLRGGLDVARRTLAPRLDLSPGFIQYRTRLPSARARLFFANCVNLLPGTLAAELRGDCLEIHYLSDQLDLDGELRSLEDRVAALFGHAGVTTP